MTLLLPVITYGAETWPLRKYDERKLIVWEIKVLRKIYGPMKDSSSNEWRIRTNNELGLLLQKPNMLDTTRSRRLKWAGHAWRSQNPLLRIVLEKDPVGKRPLGRPRMRWEDLVKKDVSTLGGGSDWIEQVSDRNGWREGSLTGWS